jgi:hypothetical protein
MSRIRYLIKKLLPTTLEMILYIDQIKQPGTQHITTRPTLTSLPGMQLTTTKPSTIKLLGKPLFKLDQFGMPLIITRLLQMKLTTIALISPIMPFRLRDMVSEFLLLLHLFWVILDCGKIRPITPTPPTIT